LARLQQTFRQLLAMSPRAVALEQLQNDWGKDHHVLLRSQADAKAVADRRQVIEDWLVRTKQAMDKHYTLTEIRNVCVDISPPKDDTAKAETPCVVTGFGHVNGDRRASFQMQTRAIDPNDTEPPAETVVFYTYKEGDAPFHVAAWGDFDAMQPLLSWGSLGEFLIIRSYPLGAAGRNYAHSVYVVEGPEQIWREVNTDSWEKDLERRLGSLSTNAKPEINWYSGQAEVTLMRSGDPMCCPTGGTARVTLGILNRTLVIKGLNIVGRKL